MKAVGLRRWWAWKNRFKYRREAVEVTEKNYRELLGDDWLPDDYIVPFKVGDFVYKKGKSIHVFPASFGDDSIQPKEQE